MYKFLVLLFSVSFVGVAYSQVDNNSGIPTSFRDTNEQTSQVVDEFLALIKSDLNEYGLNNIKNAEKIYYYEVINAPKGYDGYTINGFAVRSFGGMITEEVKPALIQVLFGTEGAISLDNANCVVKPKVMFRFVRGVDYTDVLLSSPCQSMVVYYAGNINIYNLSPIATVIDTFVKELTANTTPFVSPALLNQTLPVGIVNNEKEKELVNQANKRAPVRDWNANTVETTPKKPSWGSVGGI